jgi:hypothetical protein
MANYNIGSVYHALPCRCGCADVTLWTDTGTNDFFIECDNDGCDLEGPEVCITERGESMFGLVNMWNAMQVGEA